MYLNKGPWTSAVFDSIEGALSTNMVDGNGHVTLFGPERTKGDVHSSYSPLDGDKTISPEDHSPFADLYRKMEVLVKAGYFKGPWGEDHPAFFRRFEYFSSEPLEQMLKRLTEAGIWVSVAKIFHTGNQAEVDQVFQILKPWSDEYTQISADPIAKREMERREAAAKSGIAMARAKKQDRFLMRFVLIPLWIATSAASVLGYVHFPEHRALALGAVILTTLFPLWWVLGTGVLLWLFKALRF